MGSQGAEDVKLSGISEFEVLACRARKEAAAA
jgi:hypothetical protein